MNVKENVFIAIDSVRSNLLRSILTMLIIAVGIWALVGILTAFDALLNSLQDNFSDLGANSFSIERKYENVRGRRGGKTAKIADPVNFKQANAFKERFNFPSDVTIWRRFKGNGEIKVGKEKTNPTISITGIDKDYLDVHGPAIEYGRAFSATEIQSGGHQTILGMDVVAALFDGNPEKALGKTVNITGAGRYRVIGVLESKGSSMGRSNDGVVLIPLLNARRLYATSRTSFSLDVKVNSPEILESAKAEATGLFRNIRKLKAGEENDFNVRGSDNFMSMLKENTATIRFATIAVGFITLLGAAIGLMNIMLVTVTERTKEIGLRKAIGATPENIRMQFLTEAIVICQLGGFAGIIFGLLTGYGMSNFFKTDFLIPWAWITLGIVMCFVVGLISGLYPAIKASKLDPIEALRFE